MSGSKLRDTVRFDHAQAARSSSAANSLDQYTTSAPRVDSLQSRQIRTHRPFVHEFTIEYRRFAAGRQKS
jgi:hypothetical protein